MTPDEAKEKASSNFKSGMNCAQAVASVFAEELGYSTELIQSLALPFGAGMCRMREVCGTVSGMMLALGMSQPKKSGGTTPAELKTEKDSVYADGQKLAAQFREKNGSILCRELLGLVPLGTSEALLKEGKAASHTPDSPISQNRTDEYYKKRPCAELCGVAAEIFQTFLDEKNQNRR